MAVLRCIPNITLVEPVDKVMLKSLLPQIKDKYGVCYIRLNRKMDQPDFLKTELNLSWVRALLRQREMQRQSLPAALCWSRRLRRGLFWQEKAWTCGSFVCTRGNRLTKRLLVNVRREAGAIVTAENHTVTGGLGRRCIGRTA